MTKGDRGVPSVRAGIATPGRPRRPAKEGQQLHHRGPSPQTASSPNTLVARLLDTPHLAHAVPLLPPEFLHSVVRSCGLEDCGELMALATPEQLSAVFDLDLWRSEEAGQEEAFDAERFWVWLEVLGEQNAALAADRLAAIDPVLVTAALSHHARVFDPSVVTFAAVPDDDTGGASGPLDEGLHREIGGYLLVAKLHDSWDTIVTLLTELDERHTERFHRVMQGCRRLSNSTPEIDGLDDLRLDSEQTHFDLGFDRERRREQRGYVTPAQARAFLRGARQAGRGQEAAPPVNPVATAYFRALAGPADADTPAPASGMLPASNAGAAAPAGPSAGAVAAVIDILEQAGVLPGQPRALLGSGEDPTPRIARIRAQMQFVHDRDPDAYARRTGELAFLANTLVAGCSLQTRPFTAPEASDAVLATCNLGLENWPRHWRGPDEAAVPTELSEGFLADHDLAAVFDIGWARLHEQVSMFAAKQLIDTLAAFRCSDRETQAGLTQLRTALRKHWLAGEPWLAGDAMDVIAILDTPAWAALLGLIAECPVTLANVTPAGAAPPRSIDVSAFEFISENRQIAAVHTFMHKLPELLSR